MLVEVLDPEFLSDAVYGNDHTLPILINEMLHYRDSWVQVPASSFHTSFRLLHCEAGFHTGGFGLLHCEARFGTGESLF